MSSSLAFNHAPADYRSPDYLARQASREQELRELRRCRQQRPGIMRLSAKPAPGLPAMNDALTNPDAFAHPPLTAERMKEIKADIVVLNDFLLQKNHPRLTLKLLDMVHDLVREVERADGLMLSLLNIALADCTADNHDLRKALARRKKPDPSS